MEHGTSTRPLAAPLPNRWLTLASLPPYTGPPPCPNSPPCPDAPAGKRSYQLEPLDLGIPRCTVQDLAGGDAALNAQILMVRAGGRVVARDVCAL